MSHQSTKVTLRCATCGSEFIVKAYRTQKAKYCCLQCMPHPQYQSLEERFWSKVNKTSSPYGCWLWIASLSTTGYGQIYRGRGKGMVFAHRVSWLIHFGDIPEGMSVLHNCPGGDNPLCVNPAHLWLGTQADNMHDMWAKGRQGPMPQPIFGDQNWARVHRDQMPRGDRNPSRLHPERLARGERSGVAKLNEDRVRQIRSEIAAGTTTRRELAERFGIGKSTVNNVVKRKTWLHVI